MRAEMPSNIRRVGFVATRISGTDGVSLEAKKWADILESMGLECYYIAGESDRTAERTVIIDQAHFKHDTIQAINRQAFGTEQRSHELSRDIMETSWAIRDQLELAIRDLKLDVLIAENSLTIPMNIPLGLAIVSVVQELGMPCIAHHHDFHWERDRFLINSVDDFIQAAFPPSLPQIEHVVLNSLAAEEFSRRTGVSCRIIPNVMNFAEPPAPLDEYARQFRQEIGLRGDDLMILQPTRVVQRKGIEHSIELVQWLDNPRAKLVITHSTGDEGDGYAQRIRRFAKLLGVDVIFAEPWISDKRGVSPDGKKQFTIWDVFPQADLVTYPSTYEGFGNAFLETVYFKQPIVCNRYSIFRADIEPCGFKAIKMNGYLVEEVVDEARRVLEDADYRREMVEHNYQVGRRFFSYDVVIQELSSIFSRAQTVCRCEARCAEPPEPEQFLAPHKRIDDLNA